MPKGTGPVTASFAKGGKVIATKNSSFFKGGDEFTGGRLPPKNPDPSPQEYGKKK
jgi:hypothetical protein